ncbi:MAG: phosphotransferase, partial [Micromonosporaceae bacterium]
MTISVGAVKAQLAEHWGIAGDEVALGETFVAHHERLVCEAVDPAGRRVAVKAAVDRVRLRAEVTALRAAAATGVDVPEVLTHLHGGAGELSLLVMSWVEGEPLLSTSSDRHWSAVAGALRVLHDRGCVDGLPSFGGDPDWRRSFRDWLATWQERPPVRDLFPPSVLRRLLAVASTVSAAAAPVLRLLHGDSSTIHWRVNRPGGVAAIDLGDSCVGDPLWDLVTLTHWDDARLPVVLDGYGADPQLRNRAEALYEPYRVSRHLLAIDWLCDHGFDPMPTVKELTRLAA